jgi:acyl-homoserine-lactone acylase
LFASMLSRVGHYTLRVLLLFASACLLTSCVIKPVSAPPKTEILWDRWGIPHIFAQDAASAFRAFGWAQMHSHGDLILRLYAQGRGRGAEFYGQEYLAADQSVRLLGIPERGAQWYAEQSPSFKVAIDAFVEGMNDYVRQQPDQITADHALLPVEGADIFRHMARVMALFVAASSECGAYLPGFNATQPAGSTGWAIAPAHSASSNSMLLANPHLAWDDFQTLYEAQIVAPGVNSYGATWVGFPTLAFAFNDNLGWTHTFNAGDACDLYTLTPTGSTLDDGYLFDNQVRSFETITQSVAIKQADGSIASQPFVTRRALQGPVLVRNGQPFAIRIGGQDEFPVSGLAEQWWAMGQAQNWAEFDAALQRKQLPLFNVVYADRKGHIFSLFAGNVPVRANGNADFWKLPVPGDSSKWLWTEAHSYAELPQLFDPPSGWVQDTSGVPWYMTMPPLDPAEYPQQLAPRAMTDRAQYLRTQQSLKTLSAVDHLSFEQMVEAAQATEVELTNRVLDELIAAARQSGSDRAKQAAAVLATWNRQAEADSRGTALFTFWFQDWVQLMLLRLSSGAPALVPTPALVNGPLLYVTPWSTQDPLDTPQGLFSPSLAAQALESAANDLQAMGLPLDASWGEVARFRRGKVDLPANGGNGDLGTFRAFDFAPGEDGRLEAVAGSAYLALIEFGNPVHAMVLTIYGNSSQSASPHFGDQLTLAAQKELRPALRSRSEIEANLEARTVLE